jgi:hypothetical protein
MRSSFQSFRLSGLLFIGFAVLFLFGCKKQTAVEELQSPQVQKSDKPGHLKQTKTFSSEVPIKWLQMLLRVTQVPPGTPAGDPARILSYGGVALYEAVVNGMPSYQTLSGQLNEFPVMPQTTPGLAYHWAASANAAFAYIAKSLLPNATALNKGSMDSLENALNTAFTNEAGTEEVQRSIDFGREVARRVFEWSKTDGSLTVRPTYVPPVGTGLWAPTPPNFPAAVNPYLGLNRLMVAGSNDGASQPPPVYSTAPGSAYYAMVKEVYDISQNLTQAQRDVALWNRSNPGWPAAGQFVAIFYEVLKQANPTLDVAAEAIAKEGIGLNDMLITIFKEKYTYNVERPIKYIREVLGHSDWNTLFPTPGHPEFPSAHASISTTAMEMLASVFGDNFSFTDHTYEYLGMPARSYNSFHELAIESGLSRIYAGIHYRYSVEKGWLIGKKVADNIFAKLKFKKE